MKCDRCKKNEAKIVIGDNEHLCVDCYNEIASKLIGAENFNDYDKNIYIYENDGSVRQFSISHMYFGDKISWTASEVGGAYEFAEADDAFSDHIKALKKLHMKVIKGVMNKTLRESKADYYLDNVMHRGNKQYSLKDSGVLRILSDDNNRTSFIIDGMEVSSDELASLLSQFSGFNLEFRIKDVTDDIEVFEDKYN